MEYIRKYMTSDLKIVVLLKKFKLIFLRILLLQLILSVSTYTSTRFIRKMKLFI